MKSLIFLRLMAKWLAIVSTAVLVCGFYGVLIALIPMYVFDMSERTSLLFIGLPCGILIAGALWSKLPKILGY